MSVCRISCCNPRFSEPPLFPYTTLFRSSGWLTTGPKTAQFEKEFREYVGAAHALAVNSATAAMHLALSRSEEHTSELQSHVNLVCRLLLEKKNKVVH